MQRSRHCSASCLRAGTWSWSHILTRYAAAQVAVAGCAWRISPVSTAAEPHQSKFLEMCPLECQPFLRAFFETQIFCQFLDTVGGPEPDRGARVFSTALQEWRGSRRSDGQAASVSPGIVGRPGSCGHAQHRLLPHSHTIAEVAQRSRSAFGPCCLQLSGR